jgi:nicotinamidase-related amidase
MADSPTFGRYAAATLPLRRTALLLVDMQHYFVDPRHPFGRQLAQVIPEASAAYFQRVREVVLPNAQRLLEAFRKRGQFVAFTEFGSLERSGADLPGWASIRS